MQVILENIKTAIDHLRITFNNFAVKQTGMNSAFSYNIENAVAGTYPNYTIAYANVLVGRGDLPNVLGPASNLRRRQCSYF